MGNNQNKLKVYLASGWFTDRTRAILDRLEPMLDNHPRVTLYSPRRDGVMLPPNQKHDTSLRESIFTENIQHIVDADLVIANIDSVDSYNDPGTIYEIGYAMAHNVPVVGFTLSILNITDRFAGVLPGFECIAYSYPELCDVLDEFSVDSRKNTSKVLLVGSGDEEVDGKIASYIVESGANIRWVYEDHTQVYANIEDIFKDVQYMVAVIDDRKTIVSWMIGQAYARGIPVITYSNYNYGINVMLLVSVLTHIRGTEELQKFLQQVKRGGLESIPKFDISQMDSM